MKGRECYCRYTAAAALLVVVVKLEETHTTSLLGGRSDGRHPKHSIEEHFMSYSLTLKLKIPRTVTADGGSSSEGRHILVLLFSSV